MLNYPLYDQAGYNGDLALLRLDSPVQIRLDDDNADNIVLIGFIIMGMMTWHFLMVKQICND